MSERPNVLILYTDQQRWDSIHAAGNSLIHTPNLDRLAARGALFENAFCNNPVCMPSRQSMLSGMYPSAVGCAINGIEMRPETPTIATFLKPYDYHTANIGKLHFKNHSNRDHRDPHPRYDFDTLILSDEPGCYDDAYIKWVEEKDRSQVEACRCSTPPACVTRPVHKQPRAPHQPYVFEGPETLTHSAFVASETIDFIHRHRTDRFFAIAGFYAPHAPLNPPARFVEMYNPDDMPEPLMNEGENERGLTPAEWRRVRQFYYALISHVDDQVGRILDALDEEGLTENTLVLFTSDHGEHLGDHGQTAKGPPGLDSCSHVPLLVSWPGQIPGGTVQDDLIEAVDLVPSILDYCGVQTPAYLQGRSFRPLLEQRSEYNRRKSVFIEYHDPFGASWKTVRTRHAFYTICNKGTEMLFDLDRDPHQLKDLSTDSSRMTLRNEMRAELLRRWFDVESELPRRTAQY